MNDTENRDIHLFNQKIRNFNHTRLLLLRTYVTERRGGSSD